MKQTIFSLMLIFGLLPLAQAIPGNSDDHSDQAYLWIHGTGPAAKSQVFVVKNTGTLPATNIWGKVSGGYKFVGGSFPGTGGTCNKVSLDQNNSCKVVVEYTGGPAALKITYANGYGAASSSVVVQ